MTINMSFICVGAQKAGTSTLHDILMQHPDLILPELKETHHFRDEEKFNQGKNHYFDYYFKRKNQNSLYGEIDPEYSYFENSANRIKSYFPNLKIIFVLRNPVDRAHSHYLMTKRRGLETLSFDKAVKVEEHRLSSHYNRIHFSYVSRGRYLEQIIRFENLFGADNVKIVLFDDFVMNTKFIVDDITKFIGLSEYDYDYQVKSNSASESRSKFLRDFIYQNNKLKTLIGKAIPSKKLKDIVMHKLSQANLKPANKEILNNDLKKDIYNTHFKHEIENLENKIGMDLSKWKY